MALASALTRSKSCARFAGRWLDAELEARPAPPARRRRATRSPRRARAPRSGSRALRDAGPDAAQIAAAVLAAPALARDAAAAERAVRRAAGAFGPGVRSERDGVNVETDARRAISAAVALGVVALGRATPATTSGARAPPPRSEALCAPSESLAGEMGNAETRRTRTSAVGGERRRTPPPPPRRSALARWAPPSRRTGPARVRGATEMLASASRVSAARRPRAAGRPLRRTRAGPRARRRRRRRVRARRDAARFRIVRDFETLEAAPAARLTSLPSAYDHRTRARSPALTRRLERGVDGTRTRTRRRRGGGGGGGGGGAGGAHRGGGCARPREPRARRLGVARVRAAHARCHKCHQTHQTRAKKNAHPASAATCASRAWPPRVRCSTSRSLPASPTARGERRREREREPPARLWRCPKVRGGLRLRGGGGRGDARRGRDLGLRRRAGRLVVPGGRRGSRQTPRTRVSAAPSRERERGAPRQGGTGTERGNGGHTHTTSAVGRRLWRRAGARRSCGRWRRRRPRRAPPRAGGGSDVPRARRGRRRGASRSRGRRRARARARPFGRRARTREQISARGSQGLVGSGEDGLGETKCASVSAAGALADAVLTGYADERARRDPGGSGCFAARARARVLAPLERLPAGDWPGALRRLARAASALETEGGADALETADELRDACAALAARHAGPGVGGAFLETALGEVWYPPTSPCPRAPCSSGWARASPRSPRARGGGARRRRRRRAGAGASAGDRGGAFFRLRRQIAD